MQLWTFSILAVFAYAIVDELPPKGNAIHLCVFSDAHLSTFTTDYLTAGSDVAFDSFWRAINNIRRQNCDAEIFLGGAVRQNGTDKQKGYDHEKFWLSMCPSRNGRIAIPCIAKSDVSELYTEEKIRSRWQNRTCSAGSLYNETSKGIGHFTQKVGNLNVHVLNTIPFEKDTSQLSFLNSGCNAKTSRAGQEMQKLANALKSNAIIVGHLPPLDENGERLWHQSCLDQYNLLMYNNQPILQLFGNRKLQYKKYNYDRARTWFQVSGGLLINKNKRPPVFETYDIEGSTVKGYTHSMQVDNHMMTGNSFITNMTVPK